MLYREAMQLDLDDYPEQTLGEWAIEHKSVEANPLDALRAAMGRNLGRHVPEGTYIGLRRGRTLVMSNTPDEMRDHAKPFWAVQQHGGGRVLIHGLGLGMFLRGVLSLESVKHVDVVEIAPEVVKLVGPAFADDIAAGRLTIHQEDCLTKTWPRGSRWTVVWHDIWDYITEDNLESMRTLHRRFGRRCEWQGSWSRDLIR